MSPQPSPGPSAPPGKHLHKGTSKPVAVPLGKVGVAFVDDDENFHVLVRGIVEQARKFHWVSSYFSGEAALIGIPQSGAQVVLMDIKMPGMSGIECARRLKALLPHLIIIMVTGLDDPRTINLARECGADGFLAKPFSPGQFLATLSFCMPRAKAVTAKLQPSTKGANHQGLRGRALTARENEFMKNLAQGLLFKEIAAKMGVSFWVIHNLQRDAYRKLQARNRTEAISKWQLIQGSR